MTAHLTHTHRLRHSMCIRKMFCIHSHDEGPHDEGSPSPMTGLNQQQHVSKPLLLRSTECLGHAADVGATPFSHHFTGKINPGDYTDIKSSRHAEAIT